jgi:hypothetical protein
MIMDERTRDNFNLAESETSSTVTAYCIVYQSAWLKTFSSHWTVMRQNAWNAMLLKPASTGLNPTD